MRNTGKVYGFTDLDESSCPLPPHVLIRAADFTQHRFLSDSDLFNGDFVRRVVYKTDAGLKYYLELVPYIHPSGAGTFTLGTVATDATTGVVTYTPSAEGRMMSEAGALAPTGSAAIACAGVLFADYFTHWTDNQDQRENFRCINIAEGDFVWLIRKGVWEVDVTSALNAGDDLMISGSVAGECDDSTAIDTTTAITLEATQLKHLTGEARPKQGCCVGLALATVGGAGLVKAELRLPRRFYR